ncbi:MAG: hypothetical protein VX583_04315, partial [Bdellovibrionota bacterium]
YLDDQHRTLKVQLSPADLSRQDRRKILAYIERKLGWWDRQNSISSEEAERIAVEALVKKRSQMIV